MYGVICVWTPYLSNGRQEMTRIQELGLAHIVAMVHWLGSSPGILCIWDMSACASVGLLLQCLWWGSVGSLDMPE